MNFEQFIRKTVRIVVPLALGFLLLWYLYRDQDLEEMMNIIKKGVRYDILLFSLIFGLGANVARGYRWGLLIDSLGVRSRRMNDVLAVLGNYAINMVLPRIGEIWRCGIITKYEKTSFSKLLGTLLVDRVMDTLVVALVACCVFAFNIHFFSQFYSENPTIVDGVYSILSSVWTYVFIGGIIVVFWLLFTRWKHLKIIQKTKEFIQNIWIGIQSLWKMKHKTRFFVETCLIWGGYFLYFYVTFFAFDFTRDLGVRIALIAFVMSSIGVAVPVQGGIGVWHFMVIATLTYFGVNKNDAGAFAMVVFTVQTVWVVVCGLAGIFALPVVNRKNQSVKELS
ncbi:MAG: flippase-like domain-containing protein [Tannerella sp.]|jgi:uncharacterized membrane protein YbhN (UPF0104 family)|nr:flippase-like domain-containing protein [Tannerella sp.]